MRAFGSRNQLDHFFRAAEPILNHVRIGAERFGRKGRGHPRFRKARVFGDEANFIHSNSGVVFVAEVARQPIGKRYGIRARFHEAFNEIHELLAVDARQKSNTRHPSVRQEIREASFRLARIDRNSIQQQLGSGSSEQQASLARRSYRSLQFLPGGFELFDTAGVL